MRFTVFSCSSSFNRADFGDDRSNLGTLSFIYTLSQGPPSVRVAYLDDLDPRVFGPFKRKSFISFPRGPLEVDTVDGRLLDQEPVLGGKLGEGGSGTDDDLGYPHMFCQRVERSYFIVFRCVICGCVILRDVYPPRLYGAVDLAEGHRDRRRAECGYRFRHDTALLYSDTEAPEVLGIPYGFSRRVKTTRAGLEPTEADKSGFRYRGEEFPAYIALENAPHVLVVAVQVGHLQSAQTRDVHGHGGHRHARNIYGPELKLLENRDFLTEDRVRVYCNTDTPLRPFGDEAREFVIGLRRRMIVRVQFSEAQFDGRTRSGLGRRAYCAEYSRKEK